MMCSRNFYGTGSLSAKLFSHMAAHGRYVIPGTFFGLSISDGFFSDFIHLLPVSVSTADDNFGTDLSDEADLLLWLR